MGPQSYTARSTYWNLLVGNDLNGHSAFAQAVFHQTTILRRCFRDTVFIQMSKGKVLVPLIQSVVAEVQADLNSPEMKLVAVQLSLTRYSDGNALQSDEQRAYSQFILALYHFCQLLIVLMEGETVAEGTSSHESLICSLSLLRVMQAQITPQYSSDIFPLNFSPFLIPRMLWISGLARRYYRPCLDYPTTWTLWRGTDGSRLGSILEGQRDWANLPASPISQRDYSLVTAYPGPCIVDWQSTSAGS